MTEILKQKILEYINKHRRSVRDLERQAGLKYNAIHNILSDRSKSPSLYTTLKIADAIGCSLDEIAGRKKFVNKIDHNEQDIIILESELFRNSCKYIGEFADNNNVLSLSEALGYIDGIYRYCLRMPSGTFDQNFADWFSKQKLIKRS